MIISDTLFYIYQEYGKPIKVVLGSFFAKSNYSVYKSSSGKFYMAEYIKETNEIIIHGEILDTIEEQYKVDETDSTLKKVESAEAVSAFTAAAVVE